MKPRPAALDRRAVTLGLLWTGALGAAGLLGRRAPGLAPAGAPSCRPSAPGESAPSAGEGTARSFRGGPRGTGRSAVLGPATATLAWRFATGGPITGQAVADARGRLFVGSHDGHLYALSERGALLWRRPLGRAASAPAAVYGAPLVGPSGRVYVGSDSGALWCFDARGKRLFRVPVEDEVDSGVRWSPAGQLHFCAGSSLYAVTPAGELRWRYRARGKLYTTPAVGPDGVVYVGSQDDRLYAVEPDGALRWAFRAGGDVDSSPLVGDDGGVFFGADDGQVYALGPGGALRWATPVQGYVRAPLGLGRDGAVLAGVCGPRPRLVALDPLSGCVRWSFALPVVDGLAQGIKSGACVDAAGDLYFGGQDDALYAVNARGQLRWRFAVAGDVDSSPLLSPGGFLVFGSNDGVLYALRAP